MSSLKPAISADWLAQNLSRPDVVILDCHCNVGEAFNDSPLYPELHVPNAFFCSIDSVSDKNSSLPHTLPTADQFNEFARQCGIHAETHVICYSFGKLFTAPRIWWMFRVFGHKRVSVLDASLEEWQEKELPLSKEPSHAEAPTGKPPFKASLQPHLLVSNEEIKSNTSQKIIDARSAVRFYGKVAEPRNHASGHIPNSINLPFTEILHPDKTILSHEGLKKTFSDKQIDPDTPHIFSCGSGITACILAWGQAQIGSDKSAVYDGSWAEWSSDPQNPIAK